MSEQDFKELSQNQRNSILFRRNEKIHLNFLKDCADKIEKVSKMTSSEALLEI